jgi:hypothetical protein
LELAAYPEPEKLFAWAKYLYCAELLYRRAEEHLDRPDLEHGEARWRFFATTSQWYASEFVVIEGWHELRANDAVIARLLGHHSSYVDQLRRFRNTVFHYQPSLLDKRILEFNEDPMRTVPWLHHLHAELTSVLLGRRRELSWYCRAER